MRSRMITHWTLAAVSVAVVVALARPADAATISWKGHSWNVTNGGMAGVCAGNPANVSVDANGYLHLTITNNGGTWTAAEIFSTDKIGFGTYQWQLEGPIDKLDKNVVVGLYPYGPAAGLGESGNNEIDIEFARWGNAAWPNGNYTIWPPTGTTTGSHTFEVSLGGGTSITTRFTWSSSKIDFATLGGFVDVDATSGLIDAWSFAPANPATRITQQAMPLGMNLWCYDNPPSDGKNVEIVVRDFQFVPLGTSMDGGAMDGGARGLGGAGVDGGARGLGGAGGAAVDGGARGLGGAGGAADVGAIGAGGAMGTGGTGVAGAPGSGGAGRGGAAAGGAMGSGGVMGTGGAMGSGGTGVAGATGSGGAGRGGAAAGGAMGTGGSGAGGAVGPASKNASGCGCEVGGAPSSRGGLLLLLPVALWLVRRRKR
jgi:hypothetical protein